MKTLARMLCLALIALPLGCDGGRSEERAPRPQLSPGPEMRPETPAAAAATAAGVSESGIPARAEPHPQPSPEPMEPAQPAQPAASPAALELRDKLPRDLWIWPDARKVRSDLDADILECTSRLVDDRALSARSDLAQLGWILDCMSGRGWARNPDFVPARG